MKSKYLPFAVLSTFILLFGILPASGRTWTDVKTGRTLEGAFVKTSEGKVSVRRSNRTVIQIDLKLLSKADQDFVAAQGKAGGEASWTTFRGASRTDHSPDEGLLETWPKEGPELLWEYRDCGKGYSGPAIVGGKIYYTGSFEGQAKIICLNEEDGEELWTSDLGEDPAKGYSTGWGSGPRGTPTVSDGVVYAISANGSLMAVVSLSLPEGKMVRLQLSIKKPGRRFGGVRNSRIEPSILL